MSQSSCISITRKNCLITWNISTRSAEHNTRLSSKYNFWVCPHFIKTWLWKKLEKWKNSSIFPSLSSNKNNLKKMRKMHQKWCIAWLIKESSAGIKDRSMLVMHPYSMLNHSWVPLDNLLLHQSRTIKRKNRKRYKRKSSNSQRMLNLLL